MWLSRVTMLTVDRQINKQTTLALVEVIIAQKFSCYLLSDQLN